MRLRCPRAHLSGAGLALLLVAGCGSSTPPGESVPELSARLSAVDRALAEHQFARARRQVTRLVRATVTARESGRLEAAEAEPILSAADSLVSALPRGERGEQPSSPPPAPQPDPEDSAEPEPDAGGEEAREERQKELEKRREELQKRREELQKELEKEQKKHEEEGDGEEGGGDEGGGNGDSSSNGPDDGHGD